MITTKKIPDIKCTAYYKDTFLGIIENEYSMNDFRIQVAKAKASGYKFYFNNEFIDILPSGHLSHWPEGFYDIIETQLTTLYDTRNNK
jgi:predicted ATPase